jgi:hypothetical protein
MKTARILMLVLAGMFVAGQAQAQAPGPGFYLGGGVGGVWSDAGEIYSDTINEDTVLGGKVFAGKMWSPNWGMEVAFHHLGRFDVMFNGAKISDMETRALSVAGVYTTALGGGFDFNARLGLAYTEATYTCKSLCGPGATPGLANVSTYMRAVSGLVGIGLGARVTQNLVVRIDFDHMGSVHHKVDATEYRDGYDMLSANLMILF